MKCLKILFKLLIPLSIVLAACGGSVTTQAPPLDTGPETEPSTELPAPSQATPTAPAEEPTSLPARPNRESHLP